MNNEKLVITIPSRGRPHNTTFKLIEKTKLPVYVYVHEPEYRAYKEYAPEHFNIVTHNCETIGEIRGLIQKQQAQMGNAILMLDDDILGFYQNDGLFKESFNTIVDKIEGIKDSHDILMMKGTYNIPQSLKTPICPGDKVIAIAYVLRPQVYEKGVIFPTDDISEDVDFTFQVLLSGLDVAILPYMYINKMGDPRQSHFGGMWYSKSAVKLYAKYGNLMHLFEKNNRLDAWIDYCQLEKYKQRNGEPLYSISSNSLILDLIKQSEIPDRIEEEYAGILRDAWGKISEKLATGKTPPKENDAYWRYCPFGG